MVPPIMPPTTAPTGPPTTAPVTAPPTTPVLVVTPGGGEAWARAADGISRVAVKAKIRFARISSSVCYLTQRAGEEAVPRNPRPGPQKRANGYPDCNEQFSSFAHKYAPWRGMDSDRLGIR